MLITFHHARLCEQDFACGGERCDDMRFTAALCGSTEETLRGGGRGAEGKEGVLLNKLHVTHLDNKKNPKCKIQTCKKVTVWSS